MGFPRLTLLGFDMFTRLAVLTALAIWFLLAHTSFGRNFTAGGNPRAAV